MADFESNIRIGIDNSQALEAIKALQRELSEFQTSMARGTAAQAATAAKYQQELVSSINATGKFSASIRTVQTTTEAFTNALEKNKLSFGQYFRYAAASTKTFGKSFASELQVIEKTARERVKDLQTQYIKLGRDASGAMKSIAVRPLSLDLEAYGTKVAIAAQKQQILNQLLKQGSTNLLNFGKNTQWAGRQLMVGFTIPLSIFGSTASKAFMELEEQVIKFKKVYGDLFTTGAEREEALAAIQELANGFTQYGVAVSETVGIAAEAAAAGFQGLDLQRQTEQSIRLSVLGQLEQQKALDTTISLQNAFRLSSENLAESINFLNAVENQTVVSLDDITTAVPKVAPVIQSLGGDVKDLAFFLAAMKEGGVNASEGANALKSGLASLINPTDKASQMLSSLGINIRDIITRNAGDLKQTVLDFALALDELDPLQRAQAIEQLFGKFQFARISTLFDNVIRDGSQASRVLDLATASAGELAAMAESELGMTSASAMMQFRKAVEDLQAALAPVGELFLEIVTPLINFASDVLKSFNNLDEGVKKFIGGLVGVLGVIGPIALMTFGLLANGVANIIKGFLAVRNVFMNVGKTSQTLGEQTEYMTQQQLEELAVAASLEQAHIKLAQAFTSEALAIDKLVAAYDKGIAKQRQFAGVGIATNIGRQDPAKMQKGGVVTVPGSGKGDKVPALLEPGEAVIPSAMAKKYAPIIQGMIAGNIPGFQKGVFLGMPRSGKGTQKDREAADLIYEKFLQSSYAGTPPREYGHQLAKTTGHSFPIFGLGGVYMSPEGKRVFVKPVLDERSALAEMRATQITRQAHGLKAPEQKIVVMRDPTDIKRERRFLALESALDATFVNNDPMALFNEDQYFKQLVASLLRVDKDLSASNVFGNVVADVGPAGVFSRASGQRDYADNLPSMEQQALINLLGIKGGAKKAFAQSTVALMTGLTPQQYHQKMIAEIQQVLPLLKQTVASFGLTDPREVQVYNDMIKRLEQGLTVDWSKFHAIHSAVKPAAPTQSKQVPGYNTGVVSVPGPKGKGDIVPAMLSPGEAVIPAKMAERYAPLIQGMIAGNIPGYKFGIGNIAGQYRQPGGRSTSKTVNASHISGMESKNLAATLLAIAAVDEEFGETEVEVTELVPVVDEFGKQVTRTKEVVDKTTGEVKTVVQELFDDVKTIKKIKDLDPTKEMMVQGLGFGGTAIPELQLRNKNAYQAAGIGAASFTLSDAANAGDLASKALAARNDLAPEVIRELELLVAEGREARLLLQSENAATSDLTYSKEVAAKAIEFAINQDAKSGMSAADAKAEAERQTAAVLQQYEIDIQEGMSAEDALDAARLRLKKAMINASKRADADTIRFTSSEAEGSSRDLLRPYNTKGPKAIKSGSFRQLVDSGKNTVSRGRDAATATVLAASVGAENAEEIYEKMILASQPSAQALALASEVGRTGALKIFQEVSEGLDSNSPSREFEKISNTVSQGVRQGTDDAAKAGSEIGQRIAISAATAGTTQAGIYRLGGPGSRRVTTDRNKYISDATPRLFGSSNDASALLKDRLQPSIDELDDSIEKTKGGFANMNSNLMNVSFAFSSIAAVTSMFGGELSGINEALFGLSNVLFALTGVMALVNMLEGVRAKILAKANMATFTELFANLPIIFGKLKAGFISLIPKILQFVRFLGPIAAAFGAFQLAGEIQKQQQAKIEGLGNAAFAAGKKLEKIGSILSIQFRNIDRSSQFSTAQGLSGGGGERVASVRESDEFKTAIETSAEEGGFKEDIERFKSATLSEVEFALNNLALELMALAPEGTDPEAIREFVAALAAEAGKTDITLDVNLDLKNKDTFAQIQKDAESSAKLIQVAYGNTLDFLNQGPSGTWIQGLVGDTTILEFANKELLTSLNNLSSQYSSFFEATKTGFLNGTLSATEFQAQISNMIAQIGALGNAGTIVIQNMFKDFGVEEELAGIEDVNNQLILLEALASGVDFTEAGIDIEAIDKMDDLFASTEDVTRGTAELAKVQAASGKAVAKTAEELAKLKYDQRANEIKIATDAIDDQVTANEEMLNLYPGLVEALGNEEEALKAVTDEKTRQLLIDAQQQDLIDGGTANYDKVVNSLNLLADSEERVNNVRGASQMSTYLADLREQNSVLSWLTQNGMTTAKALEVIGNSTLYAGAAAAKSTGSYDDFVAEFEQILSLQSKLSGGGGGEKSPFQQAIESLKAERDEAKNLVTAYGKLRGAKLSITQAFEAAKDPILAAAVATTKVGTAKWKQLVSLIKQADAAARKATFLQILTEQRASNDLLSAFTKITPLLSKMGLSLEDINKIIGDPTLAQQFIDDLKDGVINSQQILDYIRQIPITKKVEILFEMATPEGMMDAFDEAYSRQMEYLDIQENEINREYDRQEALAQAAVTAAQARVEEVQARIEAIQGSVEDKQREIELTITRPIEALNEAASRIERDIELNFNRPIANLQEESSDLANELSLMDRAAEAINEKYDAQAEALEKVNQINAEIVAKDNERLQVADALASGNVADAIRAMRKAREEEQKRAREQAAKAIEIAREKELNSLRSTSGKTREEIEQRQFEISQQIFNLEEKREAKQAQIQDIQDQIYAIEEKRKPILEQIRALEDEIYEITEDELEVAESALKVAEDNAEQIEKNRKAALEGINAQRLEWEILRDEAKKAQIESDGYLTSLEKARDMVNQIKKAWESVNTVTPTAVANITAPTATTTTPSTGGGGGGGGGGKKVNPAWTAADKQVKDLTKQLADAQTKLKTYTAEKKAYDSMVPAARAFHKKRIDELAKLISQWNSTVSWTGKALNEAKAKLATTPNYLAMGGKVGYYPMGGLIPYAAQGGMFKSINTDTVPAMLTPGEFVVRRFAVQKFGEDNLKAINKGTYNGNSVYNYEVNVSVKTDANPDQIAKAVMTQIRQIESQKIKGNRF